MKPEEKDNQLSPEEKAAFAAFRREQTPPATLEEKTVQALKARGLLRAERVGAFRAVPRFAVAIGVAAACLLLGFVAGKWQAAPSSPRVTQALFVLFLYGAETEPVHEAERIKEYGQWLHGLAENGRLASGEKLKDSGRVLRNLAGQLDVHNSPLAEEPGALGGYFIIAAANYDEALKIAAECPHLKHGGVIELREIDPT